MDVVSKGVPLKINRQVLHFNKIEEVYLKKKKEVELPPNQTLNIPNIYLIFIENKF